MNENLTYEDAIKEMEEIIQKLESENLPLRHAQELFERAAVLAKFSQEELAKTSGKLFEIKKTLDGVSEEEV